MALYNGIKQVCIVTSPTHHNAPVNTCIMMRGTRHTAAKGLTQCVTHSLYTDNKHLHHQFTLAPCLDLCYQFKYEVVMTILLRL